MDELRDQGRGWVPYIAPIYGGVEAEMLSVLKAPGPMTDNARRGSGFLCLENDDPTAERFATLLAGSGLTPGVMTPWNAYPWGNDRKLDAAELTVGLDPLLKLLQLLPRVRVVMLNGGKAQDLWKKLRAEQPGIAAAYHVLSTFHTGNQAFICPPKEREERMAHLRANFSLARDMLG
ncbi:MAG: uracil-DNA glycosylase family protein [Gaiellaceae bacterium]